MTRATRAIKILAFAGSARKDSYNKKLAAFAANTIKAADCAVTILDLHEFPLPLYDGDVEANSDYPQNAAKIKRMMKEHDGWLIASPEYNSSISGVLKNTIDWVSRSGNGEGDLSAFKGKISALVSASPGKLGGLRGLVHLRAILSNIGVFVIPNQLAIPTAASAFDETGALMDQNQVSLLQNVVMTLLDTCQRFTIEL